jgi:predicted RNase H-like nuclease (RuvC/YqgF family)
MNDANFLKVLVDRDRKIEQLRKQLVRSDHLNRRFKARTSRVTKIAHDAIAQLESDVLDKYEGTDFLEDQLKPVKALKARMKARPFTFSKSIL